MDDIRACLNRMFRGCSYKLYKCRCCETTLGERRLVKKATTRKRRKLSKAMSKGE